MFSVQLVLFLLMSSCASPKDVCQDIFCIIHKCIGCLLPDDPYRLIGSNVTLNCTLLSGQDSSFLYFQWNDDRNISSDFQRVISPSTLQLNMPIINETFDDSTFYCYNSSSTQLVGSQVLEVEYPPMNVSDVQVVVENWKSLHLSWSTPRYLHPSDIKVNVTWEAVGSLYSGYKCTESTQTSCTLGPDDFQDSNIYFFSINVTNTRINVTHIQTLELRPDTYARASPVQLVDFNKTKHCVSLSWHHNLFHSRHLLFQVIMEYKTNKSKNYMVDGLSKRICNLGPYVKYRFSISGKVNKSIYWSQSVNINVTTDEDRPYVGVKVMPGGFSVVRYQCSSNNRIVMVFFRLPDKEYWNGVLTNYKLTYVPSDGSTNITSEPAIASVFDSAKLSCDLDYDVYISVYTKIGGSPPSHLHIPKQGSVPTPEDVRIAVRKSSVQVEWKHADTAVLSWTVFWCLGTGTFTSCQSPMTWKRLTDQGKTFFVSDIDYQDGFIYGVSMTTHIGNSGIIWADCTYTYDKDPTGQPPKLKVDAEPDLGLTVGWSPRICDNHVLTTAYIIQHCIHASYSCVLTQVPSTSGQLVIDNLQEGVIYDVRIKQLTSAGKEGRYSEPVSATPQYKGLKQSEIAGIVVAVCFAVFILVVCGVQIVRYCSKLFKEKEMIVVPMKLPVDFMHTPSLSHLKTPLHSPASNPPINNLNKQLNACIRTNSTDSGLGSLSPCSPEAPLSLSTPLQTLSEELSCVSADSKREFRETDHLPQRYSMFGAPDALEEFSNSSGAEECDAEDYDANNCNAKDCVPYITAGKEEHTSLASCSQ